MAEARRLTELAGEVVSAADFPSGDLVVALSGGADSAALLFACQRLGRPVRAIHVHHGLAASDEMQRAAEAVAAALGVALAVVAVEVPAGASAENQAREARYRALVDAADEGEWILTAHTSDDQAETVIDHLLRASGVDGLAGIPSRRPPFARPFLGVSRSQTRELATLAGLPWGDDPVNEDLGPLRNRIRRRLIPDLEADYNPRLRHSLATTAALAAADASHMEALIDAFPVTRTEAGAEVAAAVITTAPPALGARLARRLLTAAGLRAASPHSVAGVLAVAAGEIPSHHPGADLVLRRRGAMVVAEHSTPSPAPALDLAAPGITDYGPWRFEAFVTATLPPAMPLASGWMVADADVTGPARVEPAADHPDLMAVLADGGVAAADRSRHPVITGPDGPIWIPMVRRLPAGWVEPTTRRYLVVIVDSCRR